MVATNESDFLAPLKSTYDVSLDDGLPRSTTSSVDFSDTNSVNLNEISSGHGLLDIQAIALLRQIFPGESTDGLKRMHQERLASMSKQIARPQTPRNKTSANHSTEGINHTSPLDSHASQTTIVLKQQQSSSISNDQVSSPLSDDFLRLPSHLAVRRFNSETKRWHYHSIAEMAHDCLRQHNEVSNRPLVGNGLYFSRVISRDAQVGFGMTLSLDRDLVRIYSVTCYDGQKILHSEAYANAAFMGPSIDAGIEPGDILIGINGISLVQSCSNDQSLLRHAVGAVRNSLDPVVVHMYRGEILDPEIYYREPPPVVSLPSQHLTQSLLDTSSFLDETNVSAETSFQSEILCHSTPVEGNNKNPALHCFVQVLVEAGLIKSQAEKTSTLSMLIDFDQRARQWEENCTFRIPAKGSNSHDVVPLFGVRKALCVRIVNTFIDGSRTAYTLWVYDVETGTEWYAPVRYFSDFQDLRAATVPLCSSIANIPFPVEKSLQFFRNPSRIESNLERETRCLLLESFIRTLCSLLYKEKPHHGMAEVAVYVQSFLGCDAISENGITRLVSDVNDNIAVEKERFRIRTLLKRSIQLYTYRLFLLDVMETLVSSFVGTVRTRGPRLQDIEVLEAKGHDAVKSRALEDLTQIQTYLDKLLDLIKDGCSEDFKSIATRSDYRAIHDHIHGNTNSDSWDRLVREAVREQIEIEVYVPLRSVVSRWLGNGWRHEDMEVQFKIKELRKRPQSFFRIPETKQSPSNWLSVSKILTDGVGLSTLPCIKLRAIVTAAQEITRLHSEEKAKLKEEEVFSDTLLGADDFIPIFIYCMVQSEMERPCALCILLRTLCDRMNRIGEVGYYLASFEAAIVHFQDIDLAEDCNEMPDFMSVPLDDT